MQRDLPSTPSGENSNLIGIHTAEHIRKSPEVFIGDESDTLKAVALWGPIGIEAYLATFYPKEVSLFYNDMDVVKASAESMNYNRILQEEGVETFLVRDYLASLVPQTDMQLDELIDKLAERTQILMKVYGKKDLHYRETITALIEADVARYGLQRAINLNKYLGLDFQIPPGNLLYARDQMNVVFNKRIQSRMSRPIRQPEVDLYELVYQQILPDHEVITIPEGETFEGGDLYIHNGVVYIGIGSRTTRGAAIAIYEAIKDDLQAHGYQFAMIESTEFKNLSFEQQQDTMHLDTFSNPAGRKDPFVAFGNNDIIVDEEEGKKRCVVLLRDIDGKTVPLETGLNFIEFLRDIKQEHVHLVPKEEQQQFGCNFQSINQDTVIVPSDTNLTAIAELQAAGKRIINANLAECTNGWGAAHCMTGQLYRKAH